MGGAPVETCSVGAAQDSAVGALADGEIDGSCDPGWQGDGCRLVALADDGEGSVASFDAEVLDVGGARFADPQPVQAEQHGERSVVAVDALGGEQELAELLTV